MDHGIYVSKFNKCRQQGEMSLGHSIQMFSLPASLSYLPSNLCLFVVFLNFFSLVQYSSCLCCLLSTFSNISSIEVENFDGLFTAATIALESITLPGTYESLMNV